MKSIKKKNKSERPKQKPAVYRLADMASALIDSNFKSERSKKISSILKDVQKLSSNSEQAQYKALGRILKNAQEIIDEDA